MVVAYSFSQFINVSHSTTAFSSAHLYHSASQATMGSASSKESYLNAPSTSDGQHDVAAGRSSCPVPEGYRNPAIYNVYSQRINDPNAQSTSNPLAALRGSDLLDPKNNMPLEANQQPCPGQRKPLSTERVQSTIPKGGTDATWLYPSPQMFFNGEGETSAAAACSSCSDSCATVSSSTAMGRGRGSLIDMSIC